MGIQILTATCVECGKKFETTSTITNCCADCWPVSVVFKEKGEYYQEMYVNCLPAEVEEVKKQLREKGCHGIRATELINSAF